MKVHPFPSKIKFKTLISAAKLANLTNSSNHADSKSSYSLHWLLVLFVYSLIQAWYVSLEAEKAECQLLNSFSVPAETFWNTMLVKG